MIFLHHAHVRPPRPGGPVSGDETERSRTVSVSYRYQVSPPSSGIVQFGIVRVPLVSRGIDTVRERTESLPLS